MAELAHEEQMELTEVHVDDTTLVMIARKWADALDERKRYNKLIKGLGIDELKRQAEVKLMDLGIAELEEETLFRIGESGLVVKVKPAGEPEEVQYTTNPKMQVRLIVE